MAKKTSDISRVHLDISEKSKSELERLSEFLGTTNSDVLRRSLKLYAYVVEEQTRGCKLIIRSDKSEKEVVIL